MSGHFQRNTQLDGNGVIEDEEKANEINTV
jgi:hypothetical protein